MFSFMYNFGVFSHKKTILLYWMDQKLSSIQLFISSPNIDGLYRFISQGSVATQLRCGDIFSNRIVTNFSQNV